MGKEFIHAQTPLSRPDNGIGSIAMADEGTSRRKFIAASTASALTPMVSSAQVDPARSAAIIRSQQDRLAEGLTLTTDFGVVEGQLSTAGIRDAIETAASEGYTLHVPGGQYRFDEPVSGRLNDQWLNRATGMRKLAVIGAGANVSEFLFLGDANADALTVQSSSFPNAANLILQGFRLHRPDRGGLRSAQGAAIRLKDLMQYSLRDVQAYRSGVGLRISGCLIGSVTDFSFTFNRVNIRIERGTQADTNVLRVASGSLGGALQRGFQAMGGSQIHISNFTMERTGVDSDVPDAACGFEFSGMGANGGVAAHVEHGYFENNRGAEIQISAGAWSANYAVTHCNFNRIGKAPGERPRAGIRFIPGPAGPHTMIDLTGSSFDRFEGPSGYGPVPNQPYLDLRVPEGFDGLTLVDRFARYASPAEIGPIPTGIRHNP